MVIIIVTDAASGSFHLTDWKTPHSYTRVEWPI